MYIIFCWAQRKRYEWFHWSIYSFLINMQNTIKGYFLLITLQVFPAYEILNQIYHKHINWWTVEVAGIFFFSESLLASAN
jgi:hypothetical protein